MTNIKQFAKSLGFDVFTDAVAINKLIQEQRKKLDNEIPERGKAEEWNVKKGTFFPVFIEEEEKIEKPEWVWIFLFLTNHDGEVTYNSIVFCCSKQTSDALTPGSGKSNVFENSTIDSFKKVLLGKNLKEGSFSANLTYLEPKYDSQNPHYREHFGGIYLINSLISILEIEKNKVFNEKSIIIDPNFATRVSEKLWRDDQVKKLRYKWKKKRGYLWCNWVAPFGIEDDKWNGFWEQTKLNMKLLIDTVSYNDLLYKKRAEKELQDAKADLDKFEDWHWTIKDYKVKEMKKLIKEKYKTTTSKETKDRVGIVQLALSKWDLWKKDKDVPDLSPKELQLAFDKITWNGKKFKKLLDEAKWELHHNANDGNSYLMIGLNCQKVRNIEREPDETNYSNTFWQKINYAGTTWNLVPFLIPFSNRWALLGIYPNRGETKYFYLSFSSEEEYEKKNWTLDVNKRGEEAWIHQMIGFNKMEDQNSWFVRQEFPEHTGTCLIFFIAHIVSTKFQGKMGWFSDFNVSLLHLNELRDLIKDPNVPEINLNQILDKYPSYDDESYYEKWSSSEYESDDDIKALRDKSDWVKLAYCKNELDIAERKLKGDASLSWSKWETKEKITWWKNILLERIAKLQEREKQGLMKASAQEWYEKGEITEEELDILKINLDEKTFKMNRLLRKIKRELDKPSGGMKVTIKKLNEEIETYVKNIDAYLKSFETNIKPHFIKLKGMCEEIEVDLEWKVWYKLQGHSLLDDSFKNVWEETKDIKDIKNDIKELKEKAKVFQNLYHDHIAKIELPNWDDNHRTNLVKNVINNLENEIEKIVGTLTGSNIVFSNEQLNNIKELFKSHGVTPPKDLKSIDRRLLKKFLQRKILNELMNKDPYAPIKEGESSSDSSSEDEFFDPEDLFE
jgi:hypothetical protein